MDRLGIECLSALAMPPVQLVDLAADLNCRSISTGLATFSANPHGYPDWSLRDAATRRALKEALRGRDVEITLGEGFAVVPARDVKEYAADLDAMCELGVTRINSMTMDRDLARSLDQFAALADMAHAAGVEMVLEFTPRGTIPDLTAAVAALAHINKPNVRLLIDTMHFARSASQAADLAALDPNLIGYVQLSDAPRVAAIPKYIVEAMTERLPPGAGELPLFEILAAVPRDVPVGLEIPELARAQGGMGPKERIGRCVDAARALLERLPAARAST
jgi:sugar phosphate isomerase/epimerase